MNYVELHLHDHFSILDGLNTPEEYMVRANELGMTHLAQTNHGTLSGHREFQRAAKAAGITPILGLEAYISETDRFDRRANNKREDGTQVYNHIGLLAMNESGLRNLNRLSAEAWIGGFYNKPRIDRDLLEEFNEDIIVTSGCLNGLLCKALEADDYDRAKGRAQWLKDVFGERFFIEIQGHNPKEMNIGLQMLGDELHVPLVVTSDCHYASPQDLWVEEAMLINATKPKKGKDIDLTKAEKMDWLERFNYLYPERKMTFQEIEIYLRGYDDQLAMLEAQGFDSTPIDNTLLVANMVGEYPYYEALDLLPSPEMKEADPDAELSRLVYEGLRERGVADDQAYIDRVEEELTVIFDKGFSVYFLILADVIRFAKEQGIFIGPGRGSGISSLCNYALHITNIDPLPYKLLFFRFLDPDREDWPDIDVDFEITRRHEIRDYVNRKYGHTANIATFTFFKAKSAIKAAASVLRIPPGEVNRITKVLPVDATMDDYDNYAGGAEFRNKYPSVRVLAERLMGRIQSTGIHAGGTILSKVPIEDYVPMQTANDPSDKAAARVPVAACDMNDLAAIGAIKYDFLGLATLTVVLDTLRTIESRTGKHINPYEITLDDPEVYKTLSAGYTKGVFQCEGGPYTNTIMDMHGVWNFEDLVSSNALVRPGASDSNIGANYIKGKETGEVEYIHADTKYFTSETFGQILFQEQQMLLCTTVAGMSMKEANQVRQAIGKKKADKLAIWEPAFIEGAAKKIGEKKAKEVWTDLEKSAKYAFNRAHSVGYSLLSYWTAWLKVNYPLEYMCSLLRYEEDKDKILYYLMEAKRMGIKVLLPHIEVSEIYTTIQNDAIRLGLSSMKYISEKVGAKIIDNRPYGSYEKFKAVAGAKYSGINSQAIKSMNAVGAAAYDDNPRTGNERANFYEILNIPAFDSKDVPLHMKALFRPLAEYVDDESFVVHGMVRDIKTGPGWSLVTLVDETGAASAFSSANTPIEKGSMYVMLITNNRIARYLTTDDLLEGKAGNLGKYLEKEMNLEEGQYRCVSFKKRTSKSGTLMADIVLADNDKNLLSAAMFDSYRQPGQIDKAYVKCASGSVLTPVIGEGKTGGLIIKEI